LNETPGKLVDLKIATVGGKELDNTKASSAKNSSQY
jgi:hypothetical protein